MMNIVNAGIFYVMEVRKETTVYWSARSPDQTCLEFCIDAAAAQRAIEMTVFLGMHHQILHELKQCI